MSTTLFLSLLVKTKNSKEDDINLEKNDPMKP